MFVSCIMGQKSHPIGLRLGIHRKWGTSWFALPATGIAATVSSRGGIVRSGREDRLSILLTRLPFTIGSQVASTGNRSSSRGRRNNSRRLSTVGQCFPIDLQIRQGVGGSLTVLLSYATLRSR